ncbi:hypothetical protein vseg_006257 [Gypsophila vaccaria]
MEIFEVGPCESSYKMGYETGHKFPSLIHGRIAADLILQNQLRPFVETEVGSPFINALCDNNRRYPSYRDELIGVAGGSGVPVHDLILLNLREEILPFVAKEEGVNIPVPEDADAPDECCDVLVIRDAMAIAAHSEDANVSVVGHTYLIKANFKDGLSYTAYTYVGELPSCAFGFNTHGVAFTLNAVPPLKRKLWLAA